MVSNVSLTICAIFLKDLMPTGCQIKMCSVCVAAVEELWIQSSRILNSYIGQALT